jgi:hypothetical protein
MAKPIAFVLSIVLFVCVLLANSGLCQESEIKAGKFDTIEALIDLLEQKGVLTEEEGEAFLDRYRKKAVPPEKGQAVVTIVPEEKEEEYIEKITENVADKLGGEVSKVREDLDYMSDELLTRSRNTNQRIDELEEKVTEDVSSKLQKSAWAQRVRFGGDIRLRYEGNYFDENNADLARPDEPGEVLNTKQDRQRYR